MELIIHLCSTYYSVFGCSTLVEFLLIGWSMAEIREGGNDETDGVVIIMFYHIGYI